MRLAVLGETVHTTRHLVACALDTGFDVNALLGCDVSGIRKRKNLTMIHGSIMSVADMNKAMRKTDAVLCVLHNSQEPLDDQTLKLLDNLVMCMEMEGVRRLVVFSYIHKGDFLASRCSSGILSEIRTLFSGRRTDTVEGYLERTHIDWTIVGHEPVPETLSADMLQNVAGQDSRLRRVAKNMVSQITDVSYLRGTLVVSV